MKEEKRKRRGRGKIYVLMRTGGERKILWEGGGGEILIWRGKRGRRVMGGFKPLGKCGLFIGARAAPL